MIQVDASKRPSIKDILSNKWMQIEKDELADFELLQKELTERFELVNKEINEIKINQFVEKYVKIDKLDS